MRSDRALPWYVFAVFVVLTLLATSYVWQTTRDADRARFDNAVQLTRDAINSRLDTYINALTATRGLMASDPALPLPDLRDYIRSHEVQRRYPGIQGIGLTLRVPAEDVAQLEAEMRRDGFADFHVWPRESRPERYAIVLMEPMDRRNRVALGYDMFTNPVRREAMSRARDTGLSAASGHVTLVSGNKEPGFLIEEWPADVVLTDLAMPRADGFDLLHWIRESQFERVRRLPVVALTAFAMNEDRERVSDAGFQGFLAKPVEPSQLRAAVSRAAARVTATTR